jgi:hypothetical protein
MNFIGCVSFDVSSWAPDDLDQISTPALPIRRTNIREMDRPNHVFGLSPLDYSPQNTTSNAEFRSQLPHLYHSTINHQLVD